MAVLLLTSPGPMLDFVPTYVPTASPRMAYLLPALDFSRKPESAMFRPPTPLRLSSIGFVMS